MSRVAITLCGKDQAELDSKHHKIMAKIRNENPDLLHARIWRTYSYELRKYLERIDLSDDPILAPEGVKDFRLEGLKPYA